MGESWVIVTGTAAEVTSRRYMSGTEAQTIRAGRAEWRRAHGGVPCSETLSVVVRRPGCGELRAWTVGGGRWSGR